MCSFTPRVNIKELSLLMQFTCFLSLVKVYLYNDKVVSGVVRPDLVELFRETSLQFENKVCMILTKITFVIGLRPCTNGTQYIMYLYTFI